MSQHTQEKISQPIENLITSGVAWAEHDPLRDTNSLPNFDILIIGSGYGGAVAAARFAGAMKANNQLKLAVLERGREILPGEFPNSFAQLIGDVRITRHNEDKLMGNADALFDLRINETVNVLLGNGLGGGSLINAAVAEAPDAAVWRNPRWPVELQKESAIFPYLERAKRFIGTDNIDHSQVKPIKLTSMKKLSDAIGGEHCRNVDIAIDLNRCVQCGDCVTGCNLDAKNTLPKTYLAHAKTNRAELYTGATVSHIRKLTRSLDSGETSTEWLVYFVLTHAKDYPSQQRIWVVKTKHLILSAGALGSTEILQRSTTENPTLQFSQTLGKNFSCNGDMIWNGYDLDTKVNAIADPEQRLDQRNVGPTIASMIDLRRPQGETVNKTPHVIQDASIPAALKRVFEEIMTSSAVPYRMINRDRESRAAWQDVDAVNPDKMQCTATFLSMGIDQAIGELDFKPITPKSNTGLRGRGIVRWGKEDKKSPLPEEDTDNVCNDPVYADTESNLRHVEELGGTLLPSPNYRIAPKTLLEQLSGRRALKSTMTVHPLGGCGMGGDSHFGVVNHYGAVFDGSAALGQHQGLYVLDGAIVPCALGINPLLSILALSERATEFIAQKEGWNLLPLADRPAKTNYPIKTSTLEAPKPEKLGFTFQEVMNFNPKEQKTILLEAGLSHVKSMQLIVEFHIQEDNLAAFLRNPKRTVNITESKLHVQMEDGSKEEHKLTGVVHWLWESGHSANQKEKHGFTRYLRHRAQADIVVRTDISAITKWVAHHIITFLNKFNIVLPSLVHRGLELIFPKLRELFKLSTHTGGHRLLRYQLQSEDEKIRLKGVKDVNYGDGSNLWRSLSQLKVQLHYGTKRIDGLHFCLDWNEIVEANSFQLDPTLTTAPRNPDIWLDQFSIFAFWARALGRIHFWSFRLPEVQSKKRHPRLPTLPCCPDSRWYPLSKIDRRGNPFHIGLTHFPAKNPHASLPPLLMIHGFGASGLQFAAPGNQCSMVEHCLTEGRDVWVAELRTSIAINRELDDKLAQWSMDEIAHNDIPALVAEVLKKTGEKQLDVLAHCIGSAMFNIAVLAGKLMQADGITPLIRRAALLQVGPVFSVSENNKLRGYFAYFAGRGVDVDFVDSSTDYDSQDATNTLVDRMLATYPVPLSELSDDDEQKSLFPVPARNQWQANYFRSSGVFGRLFSLHQLSLDMLNQLGDLLGRTNFKTFQQIIQCVMRNRLVDADGRNCYLTTDNLQKFYRFPTRFFYGEENDVFALSGVKNSVAQLRAAHGWREESDKSPYSYQTFPNYGHLDPIIGIDSARDVYPELSRFFNEAAASQLDGHASETLAIRKPDYGPVVGWTREEPEGKWISRIWISARETAGRPLYAMVYRHTAGLGIVDLKLLPIQNLLRFQYITIDVHINDPKEKIYISCLHQGAQAGSGTQFTAISCDDFLALKTAHENTHPRPIRREPLRVPTAQDALADIAIFDHAPQTNLEAMLQKQVNTLPPYKYDAPPCRNTLLGPITITPSPLPSTATSASRIALGSCRYSGTPIEQVRSNAPYAELLKQLDSATSPQMMLLMGDQVYVDATAGVADPRDIASIMSLYHRSLAQRYNNKRFAAAQVMSRLPSYMMLDDHEISDNWNSHDLSFDALEQDRCEMAIAAFLAHQWSHGPRNQVGHPHYWTQFEQGEISFFMLDTRLQRTPAQPGFRNQLISDAQFIALQDWLAKSAGKGRLRLIISPSQIHNLEDEHVLRSDAWTAYPTCLTRLCTLLEHQKDIGILCGDQHLHGIYHLDYRDAQNQVIKKIPIIVASPLYAPYPFANPRSDVAQDKSKAIGTLNHQLGIHYSLVASNAHYQGFSQLVVEKHGQLWQAQVFEVDGVTPLFGRHSSVQF